MAIQTVKVGASVNDGTGDPARTCFTKINQNFTDNDNAASRQVGIEFGNAMEVGAFGLGGKYIIETPDSKPIQDIKTGFFRYKPTYANKPAKLSTYDTYGIKINSLGDFAGASLWLPYFFGGANICLRVNDYNTYKDFYFYTDRNTTVDGNGFIKVASPIVKLFADKIECNDEANLQPVTFEKLGVGDYLIKGSTGFAQEGWYIEMPKDANGNVLVAAVYEQLANNDISVKTYDYMLNKKGRIVPDLKTPLDIPDARWVDLRLQELPQTDVNPTDRTVTTNAE